MIIHIKNLRLKGIIGIYDHERVQEQDIIINLEIHFDGTKAVETDQIEQTIDYDTITQQITKLIRDSKFYLVETLADKLLNLVMQEKRVLKARVEVDKPQALKNADSISVVAEGERN